MKTRIIIISWIVSFAFLFTDNILQALVVVVWFAMSCYLINKDMKAVTTEIDKFNKKIEELINK